MPDRRLNVNRFIGDMKHIAARDFPVREVRGFLAASRLPASELRPYLFVLPDRYTRNLIYKSDAFELLLLVWPPGQAALVHGHEGEKCWTRVEEGRLHFTNYREKRGKRGSSVELEIVSQAVGGVGHVDGPADIHGVENRSDLLALTLHLYARPYDECDVYDLEHRRKTRKKLEYFSRFGSRH